MYIPKHFSIHEWVPPQILDKRGHARSWWLLDKSILEAFDTVRDRHGPVVINTWHSTKLQSLVGGQIRTQSGLRTYHFFLERYAGDAVKARIHFEDNYFSSHKYGRAGDGLLLEADIEDVREDILTNPDIYPNVRSMELGTSWLHISTRNVEPVQTFTP